MAGKKVKGEGTIVQLEKDKAKGKCRKWQLRVSTGKDPRTGKYRTKTRRFSGTYTQAQAAMREFIAQIEGDQVVTRTGTTLNEVVADYLEKHRAAGDLAPTTLQHYASELKAACAHLGHADVSEITPRDLEDMYSSLRAGDTLSGRPMIESSVNRVHRVLKTVFRELINEGALTSNPLDKATPPSRATRERRALTPERLRELIDALDCEGEAECGYFLAASLGLRCGEVCGLSWGDVDFAQGIVSVRHSYDHFGNLKSPKTRAGLRRLPMAPFVAEGLRRHRDAQSKRLAAEGRDPLQADDAPVILGLDGERMRPDRLSARWRDRDSGPLGLKGWCLHELRHSYLSMLAAQGVHPKLMQELAGHSDSHITMDIYTHVNMDQKRGAADVVQALMCPPEAEAAPAFTVIQGGARAAAAGGR